MRVQGFVNYKAFIQIATLAACGAYLLFLSYTSRDSSNSLLDLENAAISPPVLNDLNKHYWRQEESYADCYRSASDPTSVYQTLSLRTSVGPITFKIHSYENDDTMSRRFQGNSASYFDPVKQIVIQLEKYRAKKGLSKRSQVTFVDIGARFGWYSTVIASLGYQVLSFEPLPSSRAILKKNRCEFKSRFPENKWFVFNVALGSKRQSCRMFSSDTDMSNSHVVCERQVIAPGGFSDRGDVPVERLEAMITPSLLSSLNIGSIRIDAGNDLKAVIDGGLSLFKNRDIKHVSIQYPTQGKDNIDQIKWFYDFLSLNGFTLSKTVGGNPFSLAAVQARRDIVAWRE